MVYNKSKAKGTRAETDLVKKLRQHTGLGWERTPQSGALDEKHGLKGDVYVPKKQNKYCVEVKHYAESAIDHLILSGKNPLLIKWWLQTLREADQNEAIPLLIFKHDRSKWYAAIESCSLATEYITINRLSLNFEVCMLDTWLELTKPEFIK